MMWHDSYSVAGNGLGTLLILVLLIVGVVYLVRAQGLGQQPVANLPPVDRALSILRERYAKGEIDQAEFETRKQALQASRADAKNEVGCE